ncbi:hypothetical protein M6I34_07900 [Burkholderiaceae bacterium FT117]|uniref:hypothetical protein n=1 Tax=Zeimonas sediminis TaxID=2944268 RepID=UPI0023430724|nr:hypothetical protein [Zeimonas sediminis]MCM5570428.1 hypothetical protein [Zeimonas sediminis]
MLPDRSFLRWPVAVLCAWMAGCASAPPLSPVADPAVPVEGAGFSVLPPGGSNWVRGAGPLRDAVVFGKAHVERARQGSSFVVSAMRAAARADIGSPERLRAEVDGSIRATSGRIRVLDSKTESYADAALGTDCVRFETRMEERDNPRQPGKLLLMTSWGKACRHPASPAHYVVLTCSERRAADSPSMLDDALRGECARTLDSLRFRPMQ